MKWKTNFNAKHKEMSEECEMRAEEGRDSALLQSSGKAS